MEGMSPTPKAMGFSKAIHELLHGKKLRREEWEDKGVYLKMVDEKLSIYKTESKQFHPLIVSTGDMIADEWVIEE